MKRFLTVVTLAVAILTYGSEPLKIAVISDIHFLSSKLVDNGTAHKDYEKMTGRNIGELHQILDSVLDSILMHKPDILLIAGDLTNHGERQSHQDLVEKLQMLPRMGIRTFVVPGNHDINIPNAKSYLGDKASPTSSISIAEFEELYHSFGYKEAMLRDKHSLSYLSKINDEIWLMSIDTNRYQEYEVSSITGGRILPQTMEWILDILQEAKEKSVTVLGLMHHGLVEHLPYQSTFFVDYLIDDWKNNAEILADAGLQIVFTGHFHANDVTMFTSAAGNRIYDIETGSLAQYPFPYRLITLKDKKLSINTHFVDSISGVPDIQEKYCKILESLSHKAITSKLKRIGIPMESETDEILTNLLTHISIMHIRGDEVIDDLTLQLIKKFAEKLGDTETNVQLLEIEFPPEDCQLEITIH